MKNFACFAVLFLCMAIYPLRAQVPFFQQYHPLKRNQPVQVNSLLQDQTGFIWLGTNRGLFRFDGANHKHYDVSDSLSEGEVTAVAQDSLGRIWTGHQSGHISYLSKEGLHVFQPREGNAVEAVSDILFDRRGRMWFSTRGDGLYYYEDDRLYRLDEQEGLPDLFVYDLYEDSSGNIWAGTDAGIAVCSIVDNKLTVRLINADQGLPDIIIKKIKHLNGDTLALASEDAGVILLDRKTNHVLPLIRGWELGSVTDFLVKESQVWISIPRKGIAIIDRRTSEQKLFRQSQNISLQSINALLKDRENNIWLASKTGVLRTPGDAVEHLEDMQPLRNANVLAVAVDVEDRIWFSTAEGLFVCSRERNGEPAIEQKLRRTPFEKSPVISLYADSAGYIWAGLYGSGLLRIDPRTNRVKHFKEELRNGNVLGISGKNNRIWIATLGGSTSIEFKGADQYILKNYSSDDGLSSDFIYQVFIDSRDRVWFATDGKGVSMFDGVRFHHIEEGLPSKVVYSFAEDSNGDIWVTSQHNGVLKFQDEQFVAVPELRLRDNAVQSLFADRDGNLIATHNFGIDVFDVNKKTMRYWGEESGIRDKQANLNAVTIDKFGQFYVGTTKGIMKFSLRNDLRTAMPVPAIDQLLVHGEPVSMANTPQLSYNENNVTIQYLGFWYQNAESINYLYKLENYDLEWINTRNQQVTYSRLPPGDYTFKVKASDTEDFSQVPETSVSFSISPPFWRTGAFYVFAIGLFVITAYGVMKFRERKLLEAKLILEAKVEERTKEIQQKTEEIQAQNEEIMAQAEEIQGINENLEMLVKQRTIELEKKNKALEEYAFINAHKLRSPVASILGLVNLLQKSEQQDDKIIREHLQQSADKLDAIVRSITKAIEKADNNHP